MEFMVGFLLGAACVIFLLVRWALRYSSARTNNKTPPPPGFMHQSYDTMMNDFNEESEQFLQELEKTFANHTKKGK